MSEAIREPMSPEVDRVPLRDRITDVLASDRWRLAPIIVALILIWVFFATQSSVFLTSRNLTNLSNQIAVTATLSLALILLLLIRQIDLSLAANTAVCAAVAARLTVDADVPLLVAIVAAVGAGAVIATVQSTIVTIFGAPAFIVTLGGYFILGALLLWILPSSTVIPLANTPIENVSGTELPLWAGWLLGAVAVGSAGLLRYEVYAGRRREGLPASLVSSTLVPVAVLATAVVVLLVLVFSDGIPLAVAIVLAVISMFAYAARETPFGRHVYAVGGNPEAARRSGISVPAVTTVVFAAAGALAGLAGVLSASRNLGVTTSTGDLSLLLNALAAAIIGGVSLFGGRGTIWAAVIGSLVIGSVENGLFLMDATTEVRWTVEGLVLIAAIIVDAIVSRRTRGGTE